MTFDEVNERFAVIGVGNKMVVMELNPDGSIYEFWDFEQFKKRLIKERIRVKTKAVDGKDRVKVMPMADYWLRSEKGRQYDRLVYDMPGGNVRARDSDFNGWMGFKVKPEKGDWSKNRQHIRHIICSDNEEHDYWVMNWMAHLFQKPGKRASSSLVLQGGQGIGKGHFANELIGRMFGSQQYFHAIGANQLTAEFNEHLSGKCYIFADESTWGGDPRAASKIKGLITEPYIPINRKFLKMVAEENMMSIVIASNSDWPIPVEHDDRRFVVLQVNEERKNDVDYFAELHREFQNGAHAAMLYDMLEWKVDEKLLRYPAKSMAKSTVSVKSMKDIEQWWYDCLSQGELVDGHWPETVIRKDLHDLYLEHLDRHKRHTRDPRATQTEMGMFLKKFSPVTQELRINGTRERVMRFPSLEECRDKWCQEFGWPMDYDWEATSDVIEKDDEDIPF